MVRSGKAAVGVRELDTRAPMSAVWQRIPNAVKVYWLETELLNRTSLRTRHEARSAVFDYIEGFYNPIRRHSALGYHSPASYERSTPTTQSYPLNLNPPTDWGVERGGG